MWLAVTVGLVAVGCGSNGSKAQSKKIFTRSNYAVLVSSPKDYEGASVRFVGKVFRVERDEKGTYLQVWADPKNSEWNTIVAISDPSLEVAEDDFVRVVGTVTGEYKGENALGAELTLPEVLASSITKTDALAAASPAQTALGRASWSRDGITITIQKVEFASDETRVFVAVVNNSSAPFSFYGSSANAISGGRQIESTFSPDGYPELASDLEPGAHTSGVVVFPKIDPALPLKIICEGSSDNMNIGDYGSVKAAFNWSN